MSAVFACFGGNHQVKNAVTIEPGWLAKEEAAELLGVGVRQLENRAAKGEIRKNPLPRQRNERAARVLYSIEDIEAIRAGKPNYYGEAKPEPKPEPALAVLAPAAQQPGAVTYHASPWPYEAFVKMVREFRATPPAKPWLSLAEASEWSGLPAAWLVARAREGAAFAVNVGQGSKAHWRFNREALAAAAR
jgi:hypothetical protein